MWLITMVVSIVLFIYLIYMFINEKE